MAANTKRIEQLRFAPIIVLLQKNRMKISMHSNLLIADIWCIFKGFGL